MSETVLLTTMKRKKESESVKGGTKKPRRDYIFLKGKHRNETRHAVDLLCSGDKKKFENASLTQAIKNRIRKKSHIKKISKMQSLESWWRDEYPDLVRAKGFVSKDELVKIMEWKISHSKWRPLLNGLRASNDPKSVRKHTTNAVSYMGKLRSSSDAAIQKELLKKALDELCKLKYVGPITATAILGPIYPDRVPYGSDEALESLGFDRNIRTTKKLMEFIDVAESVSRDTFQCTPFKLSDVLWTVAWSGGA